MELGGETGQHPEGRIVTNPLKDIFKEKVEGNLPFLDAVKKIEQAGLGTRIDGKDKETPFGIAILNEDFDSDDSLRNGRVLIVLSQGMAIMGHKPIDLTGFTPTPEELKQLKRALKSGSYEEQLFAKQTLSEVDTSDPNYQYSLLPPTEFVDKLSLMLQEANGNVSQDQFADLVFSFKKRDIAKRRFFSKRHSYQEAPGLKEILLALVESKSFVVSNLYSQDPRIKSLVGKIQNLTDYPVDTETNEITRWLGERFQYKTMGKAVEIKPYGVIDSSVPPPQTTSPVNAKYN